METSRTPAHKNHPSLNKNNSRGRLGPTRVRAKEQLETDRAQRKQHRTKLLPRTRGKNFVVSMQEVTVTETRTAGSDTQTSARSSEYSEASLPTPRAATANAMRFTPLPAAVPSPAGYAPLTSVDSSISRERGRLILNLTSNTTSTASQEIGQNQKTGDAAVQTGVRIHHLATLPKEIQG